MDHFGINDEDISIHIVQAAHQRQQEAPTITGEGPSEESGRWNLQLFWNYLRRSGHNDSFVWEQIQDVVIKAFLSATPALLEALNNYTSYPKNCFQFFGTDMDLDSQLKPWFVYNLKFQLVDVFSNWIWQDS